MQINHFWFWACVLLPFAHLLAIINKLQQKRIIIPNHFPSSFDITDKQLSFETIFPHQPHSPIFKNLEVYDKLFSGWLLLWLQRHLTKTIFKLSWACCHVPSSALLTLNGSSTQEISLGPSCCSCYSNFGIMYYLYFISLQNTFIIFLHHSLPISISLCVGQRQFQLV